MVCPLGDDGSEDVNDFLARIRELGDQRDREDEERSKKLEEDIAKGRQERAARRAERARSISPTKDSPASTLSTSTAATRSVLDTPTPRAVNITPSKPTLEASASDPMALEPSKPGPPAQFSLSRSNTLSWQQRPSSRTSTTVRNRPLSVASPEGIAFRSPSATPEPYAREERNLAIVDEFGSTSTAVRSVTPNSGAHPMAAMFANKDPDWFRQTADRGKNSAAYRRSEEPEQEPVSHSGNVRMPGMFQNASTPSSKEVSRGGGMDTKPESKVNLDAIRLEPPTDDIESRTPAMSPSQGKISPERTDRPSSPTKGMGGFVQSAMLKRSDSVTKRWSAQAGQGGLTRGNSTAGNRMSRDIGADLAARAAVTRTPSPTKGGLPEDGLENSRIAPGLMNEQDQIQESSGTTVAKSELPAEISTSRPSSPTKDIRRWSPVKSSWLENAINKPDSTKSQKPATPQQPAWMAEIQKAKAARVGTDGGKKANNSATESSSAARSSSQLTRSKSVVKSEEKPLQRSPSPVEETSNETQPTAMENKVDGASQALIGNEATSRNIPSDLKKDITPIKPKPETPPKKDFRSNLRQRPVDAGKGREDIPEFRKAFGNLKKAETKNYVAPDTLKETITKSKVGLNTTGGPQKTKRVDEFKESLLAKKKEFSATPTKPPARNPSQLGAKPVPEALAKRTGMLNRTQSSSSASQPADKTEMKAEEKTRSNTVPIVAASSDTTSAVQSKNSALASRFNPNLAGLLARGPPAASSSSPEKSGEAINQSTNVSSTVRGPELTHATKGRARGPKRKLPSSKQADGPSSKELLTSVVPLQPVSVRSTAIQAQESKKPSLDDQLKSYNAIKESLAGSASTISSLGISGTGGLFKNPMSSVVAETKSTEPASEQSSRLSVTPKSKPPPPRSPSNRITSSSSSPAVTLLPSSRVDEITGATSAFDKQTTVEDKPLTPAKPKLELEEKSSTIRTPPTKPKPASPDVKRLSMATSTIGQKPLSSAQNLPGEPSRPLSSQPQKPKSSSDAASVSKFPRSPVVPVKKTMANPSSALKAIAGEQHSSVTRIIQDFFGPTLPGKMRPDIDTQSLMSPHSRPTDKIRSLRKQIWELTPDGKRIPTAAHQEHILFEDSMYICTHVFGSAAGKHTTEAYLWVGDGVSPSAADDAQLFARNVAREAGASGKLIILRQGKESGNFLEALGGIVIIRRGSSRDNNSSYMLCGRKYMGQIAFDEVDFGSKSLCSGFPFIVAATDGKLFLWKGRGSGADELGCARLIAMDLGLTGEIEEVDDSKESAKFWAALKGSEVDSSRIGQHWPLKASKEGFVTRLYSIGDARPKSAGLGALWSRRGSTPVTDEPGTGEIHEITPYAQSDLSQDGIFVLDAYFEVYVILCWRSSSRIAAFKSAVYFAQEYAILAASNEDRPFVPASHVIFAGASLPYLKTSFRKWDDTRVTTQPVGGMSDAVSLPLHEVVAAITG